MAISRRHRGILTCGSEGQVYGGSISVGDMHIGGIKATGVEIML